MSEALPETPWQRLDPRMLLVHPVTELIRFLPLVLGLLVFGSTGGDFNWWQLLGVAVPVALGLGRYATTTYRIVPGQIELRRGLLSKNITTASLDRVRTVELTAPLIHRALGLARVRIGTGAGAGVTGANTLDLDSLPRADAQTLRSRLLHRVVSEETETAPAVDERIVDLDLAWVRFAPLTTSGLVIALGALAAGSQFFDRLLNEALEGADVTARIEELPLALTIVLATFAAVAAISLLSIAGYLVANWGFSLSRDAADRTFHMRRGLFTSRETSIDRDRLRGLEIHQPLGLRLAGGGRLSAIVTGLSRSESSATTIVPPAPRSVVVEVGENVLGENGPFRVSLVMHGPRARQRRYVRALLGATVPIAVTGVAGVVLDLPWWVAVAVAVPVLLAALALATDRYRRLGHALTADYLVVQSGTLSGRRDALQRIGIIGWNVDQTYFQRRAGLATLTATTAAGRQGYSAIDIPEQVAIALADEAVPGLLGPFLRSAS